jgi:L-asparaginase/Glu-tRNA(Gln) amidotransferase subunit D
MGGEMLRLLPDTTAGLVVEALPGAGGIPPGMLLALVDVARRLPVVIAPRAPFGRLPPNPTGGTGEPLADAPFLSCGPLTAEQAWLLLMLVLGEHPDTDAARARFENELFGRAAASAAPAAQPADRQDGG